MIANIPNSVLDKYMGYGFYNYKNSDMKHYKLIPFPEYAIPSDEVLSNYILEVNKFIPTEYLKKDDEFKKYLSLVFKRMKEEKEDYHEVAKFLLENNLQELLGVIDDDRTEKEISNEKMKQLMKVFPIYD